jgi:hypothetical protein
MPHRDCTNLNVEKVKPENRGERTRPAVTGLTQPQSESLAGSTESSSFIATVLTSMPFLTYFRRPQLVNNVSSSA